MLSDLPVHAIDPDGLGVSVRTQAGAIVFPHPSEFEVSQWATPKESSMSTASATKPSRARKSAKSAANPSESNVAGDVPAIARESAPAETSSDELRAFAVRAALVQLTGLYRACIDVPDKKAIEAARGLCKGWRYGLGALAVEGTHTGLTVFDKMGRELGNFAYASLLNEFRMNGSPSTPTSSIAPPDKAELRTRLFSATRAALPIKLLQRHPANRHPLERDVAALAESLVEHGQLEHAVVRPIGPERYEILSGETRFLACKRLGWPMLNVRTIECDDAEALELLAVFNAKRTDLTPIDKAKMIERLCQPKEQGGAGMTREAAGKVYGLESASAASNLVRLLKLPKVWQDRVAAGEVPETFARLLVPYAHAPRLMQAIEQEWQDDHGPNASEWERERWETRSDFEGALRVLFEDHTRPVDGKTRIHYSYNQVGEYCDYPRLFELTDDVAAKLEIHDFDVDGKKQRLATNAEYFDKLNIPLVKKKLGQKTKGAAAKGRDEKPAQRILTPEEQKERERQRREQLKNRIQAWRHQWLRRLIADRLEQYPAIPQRLLIWLATSPLLNISLRDADLTGYIATFAKKYGGGSQEPWPALAKLGGDYDAIYECGREMILGLLLTDDRNPRCPILPYHVVEDLAAMAEIDLAEEWKLLQARTANELQRATFEAFFELHQSPQLDELGVELNVIVDGAPTRMAKVQLFTDVLRNLPLPKSVKPVKNAEPTAKGKKARQA